MNAEQEQPKVKPQVRKPEIKVKRAEDRSPAEGSADPAVGSGSSSRITAPPRRGDILAVQRAVSDPDADAEQTPAQIEKSAGVVISRKKRPVSQESSELGFAPENSSSTTSVYRTISEGSTYSGPYQGSPAFSPAQSSYFYSPPADEYPSFQSSDYYDGPSPSRAAPGSYGGYFFRKDDDYYGAHYDTYSQNNYGHSYQDSSYHRPEYRGPPAQYSRGGPIEYDMPLSHLRRHNDFRKRRRALPDYDYSALYKFGRDDQLRDAGPVFASISVARPVGSGEDRRVESNSGVYESVYRTSSADIAPTLGFSRDHIGSNPYTASQSYSAPATAPRPDSLKRARSSDVEQQVATVSPVAPPAPTASAAPKMDAGDLFAMLMASGLLPK